MRKICIIKERAINAKSVSYVMKNIYKADIFVKIRNSSCFFKLNNEYAKKFFRELVNSNFSNYLTTTLSTYTHFLKAHSKLYDYYEDSKFIKDDKGQNIAIFLLHASTDAEYEDAFNHLDGIGRQQLSLSIYGAIISLDLLKKLVEEIRSHPKIKEKDKDLEYINGLIEEAEKDEKKFIFMPYYFSTKYYMQCKIYKHYPPTVEIVFWRVELEGHLLENYDENHFIKANELVKEFLSKHEKEIKKVTKEELADSLSLEEDNSIRIINRIFINLTSIYLERSEAYSDLEQLFESAGYNYEKEKKKEYNTNLVMNFDFYIKDNKSNKKNSIRNFIARIKENCYPNPQEKCAKLKNFNGRVIKLKSYLDEATIKFDVFVPFRDSENSKERDEIVMQFNYRKHSSIYYGDYKITLKIILSEKLVQYNANKIAAPEKYLKSDAIDILSILGIDIKNEKELIFLVKTMRYTFLS